MLNQPFCHDPFPMGPARSVSPRLIIPGPRARVTVARCQCSSDIHESRGARTCFRMRVSRMVHYGPHQAMSAATPIARGNTRLTIPILTTGAASAGALRLPVADSIVHRETEVATRRVTSETRLIRHSVGSESDGQGPKNACCDSLST